MTQKLNQPSKHVLNDITLSQTSDLQNKLNHLNKKFNKIVNRLQSAWNTNLKSRYFNLINVNIADKNILINALPGIEALFIEKFRLSWINFKTRFQQQMTSNDSDYKSFCTIIENAEKKLQSFSSMFNQADFNCKNSNVSGIIYNTQFTNNNENNEQKMLYSRIRLPPRMFDFGTRRYHNQVILLKSIPINFCKFIGKNQLRLAHPGYNIYLSEGFNFGKIELAVSLDGNPFAAKKLLKNSEVTRRIASKLISLMDNLLGLYNENILPYTHCIEYVTELWLATPVCDFNLETYIDLLNKKPNLYSLNIRNTVKQMVNGLYFLHHTNNGIVHGNMKPSNILIDAFGNIRMADFGVAETLYEAIQPRQTDIIWWSRETMKNYEINPKMLICNKETDIQTLGMIIHFTITKGMHPFGNKIQEIIYNKKKGRKLINLNNAEHNQMVRHCLNKYASKRPTIVVVSQHVFLWCDQKKWEFLMTCVQVQCSSSSEFENFSKGLDTVARDNWDSYLISMGLKTAGDNRSVNCCMPSRFLYYISNDAMLTMKNAYSDLRQLATSYLSSFPTLVFTMVNLVKCTQWGNMQCFQQYFNGIN